MRVQKLFIEHSNPLELNSRMPTTLAAELIERHGNRLAASPRPEQSTRAPGAKNNEPLIGVQQPWEGIMKGNDWGLIPSPDIHECEMRSRDRAAYTQFDVVLCCGSLVFPKFHDFNAKFVVRQKLRMRGEESPCSVRPILTCIYLPPRNKNFFEMMNIINDEYNLQIFQLTIQDSNKSLREQIQI